MLNMSIEIFITLADESPSASEEWSRGLAYAEAQILAREVRLFPALFASTLKTHSTAYGTPSEHADPNDIL